MPINKNIVGREITHEELQEDLFPDFGNDTINKGDTSHTITTPPRPTSTGAGVKTYIFKNDTYTNSSNALNIKEADNTTVFDLSTDATLFKSTDTGFNIASGVLSFEENKVYDIKVAFDLDLDVSSNHVEIGLGNGAGIEEVRAIDTGKLEDTRYSISIDGFVYESSMGSLKVLATNVTTGGATLKIHKIRIVVKELGETI